MLQHGLTHTVIADISTKTQALVRFYGIGTLILQVIGADLIQQANAPAFLAQIQHHATASLCDRAQCFFQLKTTVTAHAEQGIASQALRVRAQQHGFTTRNVTHGQRQMLFTGVYFLESVHIKYTERGR